MNSSYIYLNIIAMAGVTYLIRVIPLLLFRKPITNTFIKSFLFYAPYVTLAVMTFPAILSSTGNLTTAIIGFICAVLMAISGLHFVIVTSCTCLMIYIANLII